MVGILTFHKSYNYGAVLQAYALQQALKQLGATSEIIDYNIAASASTAGVSSRGWKNIKCLYKDIVKRVYRLRKHRLFDRFLSRYVNVSPDSYKSLDDLCSLDNSGRYSNYIVGSDQVWNSSITQNDASFLLSFVKNPSKRNSYAASIGVCTLGDAVEQRYRHELQQYRVLTVREQSALQMYPFLSDYHAKVVLDPTLLLTSEQYAGITSGRLISRKYAFLYTVSETPRLRQYANTYCKEHNLVLVDIKKSPCAFFRSSPQNWLSFIAHADMVFTNSFHGTAFSIIWEKPFVTEVNSTNMQNVRSLDLLLLTGLSSRDMSHDAFEPNAMIDYSVVRAKLDRERKQSLAVLKEIILHE